MKLDVWHFFYKNWAALHFTKTKWAFVHLIDKGIKLNRCIILPWNSFLQPRKLWNSSYFISVKCTSIIWDIWSRKRAVLPISKIYLINFNAINVISQWNRSSSKLKHKNRFLAPPPIEKSFDVAKILAKVSRLA